MLEEAVKQCVGAARYEYDPQTQKSLLRVRTHLSGTNVSQQCVVKRVFQKGFVKFLLTQFEGMTPSHPSFH